MSAWGECSGVSVAVGRRRCEEAGEIHGLDCERSRVPAAVSYGCDVGASQGLNLVLFTWGRRRAAQLECRVSHSWNLTLPSSPH